MTDKILSGGRNLARALYKFSKLADSKALLRVGFLEGSTYPDGTPVPMVAAIQEYGAPGAGIPARSYFRPMVAREKDTWGPILGAQLVAADYSAFKALDVMGLHIGEELQASIVNLPDEPALSQVTLMLRKMFPVTDTRKKSWSDIAEARARVAAGESTAGVSTKPLIYTNVMLRAVSHEVI